MAQACNSSTWAVEEEDQNVQEDPWLHREFWGNLSHKRLFRKNKGEITNERATEE